MSRLRKHRLASKDAQIYLDKTYQYFGAFPPVKQQTMYKVKNTVSCTFISLQQLFQFDEYHVLFLKELLCYSHRIDYLFKVNKTKGFAVT